MFRHLVAAFLALTVSLCASAGAWAAERFALVIGNSNYQSIGALPNPVRDADTVTQFLESADFEVTSIRDLGQADMRRAVRDFTEMLSSKGEDAVALVYFAGHGLQIDGQNYLLPVDADIAREADVPLEGVRLADVMNMLDTIPSKTRIVILDACRNDPFKGLTQKGRGLAIVNAPAGTVVAYSTSPGALAADGTGHNSPFTAALVEAGAEPGAGLETVFQNTRLAVHKATKGQQTPWEVTALTVPFQFFPGGPGDVQPIAEKSEAEWSDELRSYTPAKAYDLVIQQNNVIVYQIFLTLYPDTLWGRRIIALMERQLEMLAWFEAVTLGSFDAFEAFLKRFPDSDLAATAKRLGERAKSRSLFASNNPDPLDIPVKTEVRTVVKEVVREVKVPEIREVIKEVKVPQIREVIKEVRVPVVKEVIKEVRVPVVKEVIKTVKVPVVKEVIKRVKVPVIKEVVKVKTVKVPVVKIKKVPVIKTVRVPCRCSGGKGPSRPSGQTFRIPTHRLR